MASPRAVLTFCSTAHAFTHAVELSFPVLLLFLQADFQQAGYGLLALIYAGSLLLFGLGALPFGVLADRWGGVPVILLGVALSLLGAGVAILAGRAGSLALFAGAILLMGLGISTYHPAGLTALATAYPKGKGRSHAMGLHGFGGSFGQFLAPILAGVGAALLGWQWVYGGLMGVGALIAMGGLPLWAQARAARGGLGAGRKGEAPGKEAPRGSEASYLAALRGLWNYGVVLIIAITIFRGLFYRGTGSFVPALARDAWGLTGESAGLMLSLLLLAGSAGHLFGGWAHGRYGARWPLAGFAALSLAGLGLLLWPVGARLVGLEVGGLELELPLGAGLAGLLLFGFAFFAGQPVVNAHIADLTPARVRGLFFGITFATRFGLASLATALVGWVADLWSLEAALALMVLPIVATIGAALAVKSSEPQV